MDIEERLWDLFVEWVNQEYVRPRMTEEEIDALFHNREIYNEFRARVREAIGYI